MLALFKEDNEVLGIVYPMLGHHIQRFFEEQKKVFVKFVGREPQRLRSGCKLFFYESRSNKEVVGEGRIVQIYNETIDEVHAKFGDDLFLTWTELEEYAGNRKTKRVLVLVLKDIRRYRIPLRLDKSVTMAGRYMTRRMQDNLGKSMPNLKPTKQSQ